MRRIAKKLEGAEEGTTHGQPCFKASGKLFAWMTTHAKGALAVRIDAEDQELLLAARPKLYFIVPHFNGYGAVLLRLEKAAARDLAKPVTEAHRLVLAGRKRKPAAATPRKAATIDGYLATVKPEQRAALETLRKRIRAVVPKATECISYGIPAFRLESGQVVAGFCATRQGCSYFPFSGSTLATLAPALKAYGQTKSSLHFDSQAPLPAALVRKLIKARLAEIA